MLCYLDNSATTRVTPRVARAVSDCMQADYFNPSALYAPALAAEKRMNLCREAIARELHADPKRVIFTSGGTEADNLAILGVLDALRGGGRVLFSAGEHPAVRAACESVKNRFDVREIPYTALGLIDQDALETLITPDTRLICVMQVNNETGAVMPLRAVAALRDRLAPDALLHVDGVQGFLRVPVDMRALGVDSYALSGHKLHAPKGVGALVLGDRARVIPRALGGGQEKALRSGTENTQGITGLLEAIAEYPRVSDMRKNKLLLRDLLRDIAGELFFVNGPDPAGEDSAPHILNCSLMPVRSETMLYALAGDEVYVNNGSACSSRKQKLSPVLAAMHTPRARAESALRFSLSPYTTREEIEYAAQCVKQHYELLKRYERR